MSENGREQLRHVDGAAPENGADRAEPTPDTGETLGDALRSSRRRKGKAPAERAEAVEGGNGAVASTPGAEQEIEDIPAANGNTADKPRGLADAPRSVLYERARALGIVHTVSLTKDELIAAIEIAESSRIPYENSNGTVASNPGAGEQIEDFPAVDRDTVDEPRGLADAPRSVLYQRARALGIEHTTAMTKDELIAAIEAAEASPASPPAAEAGEGPQAANGSGTHPEPPANGLDRATTDRVISELESGFRRHPENGHTGERSDRIRPSRQYPIRPYQPNPRLTGDSEQDGSSSAAPPREAGGGDRGWGTDSRRTRTVPAGPVGVGGALVRQRLLLVVVAVLTLVVAGLTWGWLSYDRLNTDLKHSNARVPEGVKESLPATGAISAGPTPILFEGVNRRNQPRGSLLLLHTNPTNHVLSTLAIPQTVRVPGAVTLGRALTTTGTQGTVQVLKGAHITVGHVALVNLQELSHMVDEFGGVTINNPVALHWNVKKTAQSGTIPAGRVKLTGPQAALYLRPRAKQPSTLTTPQQRQNIVLSALIEKMLRPTSLSAVESLGKVVATSIATDLSASNVLDLAGVRLGANRFVECRLPQDGSFGQSDVKAALAEFRTPALGQSPTSACNWRPIAAAPGGVVGQVGRAVVENLPTVLLTVLASTTTLWILAMILLFVATRRTLRNSRLAPAAAGVGGDWYPRYRSSRRESEHHSRSATLIDVPTEHVEALDEALVAEPPEQAGTDEPAAEAAVEEPPAKVAEAPGEVLPEEPVVEPEPESLGAPAEPVEQPVAQVEQAAAAPELVTEPEDVVAPDAEAAIEAPPRRCFGRRRRSRSSPSAETTPLIEDTSEPMPGEDLAAADPAVEMPEAPEPVETEPVAEAEPAEVEHPAAEAQRDEPAETADPGRSWRPNVTVPRPNMPSVSRPNLPSLPHATMPDFQRPVVPPSLRVLLIPALIGAAAVGLVFYVLLTLFAG
ncbi:MAG: LCP family glycopolymer transferase [Gaiellales bacterium]